MDPFKDEYIFLRRSFHSASLVSSPDANPSVRTAGRTTNGNMQNCKIVWRSFDDYHLADIDADMATKNCQLLTTPAQSCLNENPIQLRTLPPTCTHHITKDRFCGQWQPKPGQTLAINCIKSGPEAKTTRNNAADINMLQNVCRL